jgi:16S rRNA (guanine527-N7)-methyltransferase
VTIVAAFLEHAVEQRLDAICATYGLDERARAALEQLLQALASDPHAPTTVREPAAAVDVHIADSLSALELERVRDARAIADIGAGAGFPGLALAAALPDAQVRLIESARRKSSFIAAAAQAAGIDNAEAVPERAEEWRAGIGANDVVAARALAPLAVICEYAAPLLAPGGALVAWKGARAADEEARASVAAIELGLESDAVVAVRPFEGAQERHLHVYLKVRETPERFPRRAGIARKRPLGG